MVWSLGLEPASLQKGSDSLERSRLYIYSFDLSSVTDRVINIEGWLPSDACHCETLYRNYLFLLKKFENKSIIPSEEIDIFWHNHILHTAKYFADCQYIFGKYLHHAPMQKSNNSLDLRKIEEQFDVTQTLYFEEFGEYL